MSAVKKYGHAIFLAMLAATAAAVWYAVWYAETHRAFHAVFLDVGQGDAIFLQAPDGNQVLIDGGPSDRVLARLGERLPFWDRSLDLLILTHPHADHLAGLAEVLKRYDVNMVMEAGVRYSTPEYAEWHELLAEKNVRVVIAQRGQRVNLGNAATIDILAPFESFKGVSSKEVHEAMIVAKLRYGSSSALMMGDAEEPLEYKLLMSGTDPAADILKVGHHGSKTSTVPAFVRAVAPKAAIISVGRNNRYGHPHQRTLDTLAKLNIPILRTDRDGDIEFVSDGRRFIRAGE